MPRGRPPRSDAEKTLRGNPGHRDFRSGASLAGAWDGVAGTPEPPDTLSDSEREHFNRVASDLQLVPSLLSTVDQDAMVLYVRSWSIIERCDVILRQCGLVLEGANGGSYQHPAVSTRDKAIKVVLAIGKTLGLSPLSRQAIRPNVSGPTVDPFEEFMQEQMSEA